MLYAQLESWGVPGAPRGGSEQAESLIFKGEKFWAQVVTTAPFVSCVNDRPVITSANCCIMVSLGCPRRLQAASFMSIAGTQTHTLRGLEWCIHSYLILDSTLSFHASLEKPIEGFHHHLLSFRFTVGAENLLDSREERAALSPFQNSALYWSGTLLTSLSSS